LSVEDLTTKYAALTNDVYLLMKLSKHFYRIIAIQIIFSIVVISKMLLISKYIKW